MELRKAVIKFRLDFEFWDIIFPQKMTENLKCWYLNNSLTSLSVALVTINSKKCQAQINEFTLQFKFNPVFKETDVVTTNGCLSRTVRKPFPNSVDNIKSYKLES